MARLRRTRLAALCWLAGAFALAACSHGDFVSGRTQQQAAAPKSGDGRPTDGDESLPGYLTDPGAVRIQTAAAVLSLTAPKGALVRQHADAKVYVFSNVGSVALRGKTTSGYVLTGDLVTVVDPAADGSFSAQVSWPKGATLLVTSQVDQGRPVVAASGALTAAWADPAADAALRAFTTSDVLTLKQVPNAADSVADGSP